MESLSNGVDAALAVMQLLETGQYQDAAAASSSLLEAEPEDSFTVYLLGLSLFRLGHPHDAAGVLERLDNMMIENGMEMYDWLLGECYWRCDREADAAIRYAKIVRALEFHESDQREIDSDMRSLFPGLGEENEFALAPDNVAAHPGEVCRTTGEFLERHGDRVQAERFLRLACELQPEEVLNHIALGDLLVGMGRWTEAEIPIRKWADESRSIHSLNLVGRCLAGQQRFDEAESIYRLALTLEGDDPDAEPEVVHSNLGYLYFQQENWIKASDEFRIAIELNPYMDWPYVNLALSLRARGMDEDAEVVLQKMFASGQYSINLDPDAAAAAFNILGEIRLTQADQLVEALAMFGESIRLVSTDAAVWANRAQAERRLGLTHDCRESLREANRLQPNNELYRSRLDDLNASTLKSPTLDTEKSWAYESFQEFLEDGELWLESARWHTSEMSELLKRFFVGGSKWRPINEELLFSNYEVTEELLDESLARAESLKHMLRLEIEFPVRLENSDFFIEVERDQQILHSVVGSGNVGVAISVNIENFDLHYLVDDRDAMFAAGATLNFFLDCGMDIRRHPKYELGTTLNPRLVSSRNSLTIWKTNSLFMDDVIGIRGGRLSQPPRAHRVKGFIRTLAERRPTDQARDRAPAFIRRNMGPNDTFVRPHQRGGGEASMRLYDRLQVHSSLADFLATVPRSF